MSTSTSAPTRPAGWPAGLAVTRAADRRVVIGAAVAAVCCDLAVRSGVVGVAGALLVAVTAAVLLASDRVPNPQARALIAASVLFGGWLALRTSPWLLPLDVLAAGGLLAVGASLAPGGSVLDLTIPRLAARAAVALCHGLAAPAFVAAPVGRRRPAAVLRGMALAVPLLVVLGLLLASADAVFAGFFDWWSPVTVIVHAVLLTVGAWTMAGLLRVTSAEPVPDLPVVPRRLGPVEASVVLGSIVALFGAFAVAQVVALSGGGRHVITTAGLTYAEYARSGFFQLLAVAAITLVALLGLRAATDVGAPAARQRFTVLAEVVVALTLAIVVVALRRLDLYENAFGLTMLRLYSEVFALWVGVVVVLLGFVLAGAGARRHWFLAAAGASGLAALILLNVVGPESVVARHNLARAERTQKVDPGYLAELSDDAVPALVHGLPGLAPAARAEVLAAVCRGGGELPFSGWAAANRSRQQAEDARRQVCRR